MSTTLVSAQQLRQNIADPNWRVIDCRHDLMDHSVGLKAYQAGHIPGASFASMETDLAGAKTGSNGRHPMPQREELIERFRQWGINQDTQIVAYDASGGSYAGRLWFLARWLGHAKVALLDGGWQAWQALPGSASKTEPVIARGNFDSRPSLVRVIDAAQVLAQLQSSAMLLIDARNAERFRGDAETIDPVAGRIPGASNRFWQRDLISPAGTFKPAAVLRAELDVLLAGRGPSSVVAYCGSGVTARHLLIAFEIAGLRDVALYAGSWSEWIADPARPVATGD
jgi:thiosulfate/3-mercaptopyruvate sulfurtransferase